jgi:hypothetical protein
MEAVHRQRYRDRAECLDQSAAMVDFPDPGGPVMPSTRRPSSGTSSIAALTSSSNVRDTTATTFSCRLLD